MKNEIVLPLKLDEKLAHFMGIHLGDGHLNNRANDYRMYYTGHSVNKLDWYGSFLSNLILTLFNKEVTPSRGHNSIAITFSSNAVHAFLNNVCELPLGLKRTCDVPNIIKQSSNKLKGAFLRGLADTDFSLVFKNRHKDINYYPVLDHQTSNKVLSNSVVELLSQLGIPAHCGDRFTKRFDKYHKSYYIQINGVKRLEKWIQKIGFTSPNQLTKLEVWRKFGFLPPGTDIHDRLNFLSGEADIEHFRKSKKMPSHG